MALEGTIRDFGLPDIFQLIGLQRKTGLLTLKSDKEEVVVTFENGMVVAGDSSMKRLEDRLGNVLVKQGRLTKEKLEEVLQTQKATLQRLGHILVTQNYITSKDLKDALQVQVSQIVFKLFRWREGEYHFAPTESVDYDRDNFQPLSSDFILMEGIRMVDEWPIIEKKIPSLDIVFRSVVDASMIEVGAGEGEASGGGEGKRGAASNKIRLNGEEERVFRKVDGTRTVQGIIDASGLGEFDVCRILFDLLNRNLISTTGRGAARGGDAGSVGARVEAPAAAVPGYLVLALAVVLAVAGAFAQLRRPFAVVGLPPLLQGHYESVVQGVNRARLERLDQAIRAYHLVHGAAPKTLEDLVGAGLVDRRYLKDSGSRPFHYALTESGYLLNPTDDSGSAVPGSTIERVLPVERP